MIIDDGVAHEVELPAPRDEVFDMFVDPNRLVLWIGISAQLDPRPGGTFHFEVQPGQFCEGVYVEVDRPKRLVFTWGWTDPWFDLPPGSSRVEVDLFEMPNGTRVRLVHRNLPGEVRALHDEGWALFLGRLDAVARGLEPEPYRADRLPERSQPLRERVDMP